MKSNKILNMTILMLLCICLVGVVSAEPVKIFDGTVTLEDGTFTFVPYNNLSNSYPIENMTDFGALNTASHVGDFTYNVTDQYYQKYGSFFLDDINNITNVYDFTTQSGSSWFIYVNNNLTSVGLGQNIVKDGDNVQFIYAPYTIDENWNTIIDKTNATHEVDIDVNKATEYTLINDLQDYIDSSSAPQIVKCALNTRLESIEYSLEHGNENIAKMKLRMFINAVNRNKQLGLITNSEAQYMINKANQIINYINN